MPDMSDVRVALDVMGGDEAPDPELQGAKQAIRTHGMDLLLVGPRDVIQTSMEGFDPAEGSYEIVHAPERIEMDENPVQAVRHKKDSSLLRAADAVKEGRAQTLVSAGNTGAIMVGTKIKWGVLEKVERPAIASLMPNRDSDYTVMVDVGANVDCSPKQLVQFAAMGVAYAEIILDKTDPSVGLLNLGGEARKGNRLTRDAFELFEEQPLNFIGNVEGRDVTAGTVDIVACDGFVGNVGLKISEGAAFTILHYLKQEIQRSMRAKLGAWILKPVFESLRETIDYSEYGGAPLLGLNHGCIIGHGSSSSRAIMNALRVARLFTQNECNARIGEQMKTLQFPDDE